MSACNPQSADDTRDALRLLEQHTLSDCRQLNLRGEFALRLQRDEVDAGVLEVWGIEPLQAGPAGFVQISAPPQAQIVVPEAAQPLSLRLRCADLTEVQLLGGINARLTDVQARMLPVSRLAVYGRSSLTASGISGEELDIRSSGSAAVTLQQVEVERLRVLASSASTVVVSGESTDLLLDLAGTSHVDMSRLRSQNASVKARGTSRATVQPTAHLHGELADDSQLSYRGAPDVDVRTTSNASVQRLE